MKQLLIAVALLGVFITPSFAAKLVYLKDGGVVKAQRIWRSAGTVHVLVNRDTLVDFNKSEINLKKTFVRKHVSVRKKIKGRAAVTTGTDLNGTVPQQKKKKADLSLPTMPSTPENSPAAATGKEEGSIKKYNRNMAEKAGE